MYILFIFVHSVSGYERNYFIFQSEGPVAQLYIETGIWSTLWHRVAQALQVTNPETDTPIHDIETEAQIAAGFQPPDWTLVSPQGLMAVLQIAVTVFTKVNRNY